MSIAPMAIGAGASIGANIIGQLASAKDRDRASQLMNDAANEILSVGAPPIVAREIILQKFEQAGLLTPEVENEIKLGPSLVEQIKEAPELRQAQMGALDIISQRARGGLTAEDRAALNQVRSEVAQDAAARDASILQSMQARGMAGAGNELAQRLISSQASANRTSTEGDNLAAMASRNALAAASQMGSLGNQIRGQDFDINQTRASAADAINQFNVQNAVSRQTRNVGTKNQAQQFNVTRQQDVSDANVGAANAEKQRQVDAEKWMYNAALDRAKARSQAISGQAEQAGQSAQSTAGFWSGMGSAANTAGSGIANYKLSEKLGKKV
jgi:hypothetical protein